MNYNDAPHENLLDELTRLVGRPAPVAREALSRLLGVLLTQLDPRDANALSPFPMTAWHVLAPATRLANESWQAVRSAGLNSEESFTALAVVDDHVRRTYGNDAWARCRDWAHRLALRYDVGSAQPEATTSILNESAALLPTG